MIQATIFRGLTGVRWNSIVVAFLLPALLVLAGCSSAPQQDAPQQAAPAAVEAASADAEATAEAAGEEGSTEGALAASDATAPTPAAPDAASEAQAADTGADLPALALAAPSRLLDSYRLAATYVVTSLLPGGSVHVAGTEVQGDWVRTAGPFGFDAAFTQLNTNGTRRQELGLVVIDDDAAVQTDGAWSTIRRDAGLPYTDPDSLLSLPFVTRINHGENLGRERMEGIEVTHYRLTDPAVFSAAVQDLWPSDAGIVESVLLEGWVADAGFVVQYYLQATLSDAPFVDEAGGRLLVQQQIDAGYRLRDLDAVRSIEWPADAQPPETVAVPGFVPNAFPIPDEATATPRLGLLEIRAAQSEAELASFYRSRLGELGWAVAGEFGFYTAAKEGEAINLTILADELSGETVVRVFAAGEDGVEP